MPPRKKCRQISQKPQLLFYQQPLEGPKHCYESPQLPITHTRQVPSKPVDHSTITSWVGHGILALTFPLPGFSHCHVETRGRRDKEVSPQFDTTAESWFPVNRKHHHRDQARRSSRKSTSSKFPHLTFESPQSSASSARPGIPLIRDCPSQPEKDISGRPLVPMLSPQSCGELSAHALQNFPYVFIPPDIQSPESSGQGGPIPSEQRENSLPSCSLHTSTPKSPEPGPVLVKDTPEDKYGIKVTWRRRRHLFTYLRERGKLSRSQFLVKN
ncbi:RAD9, HUS1, RAD1-interacting nuclear orphan protein 1 isoform X1 [Balaenoptera musculus]|uniref:RAD9, HUS1, RAD1-interacting nuclear orphan protein 1 isoform X1 n=1 Tax=Balaenoptera musculus TaxID=9771 RepID=A0A8B8YKP6_BALMU|nr:RAD9, HUS1, RAD1-interacting nuclear orphan protein 1 isoform X1 [Balaenoptera musculus]XP_036723017.1 RAD9, HUS1, RAD1-interacting nuclear orphan protein 1 isoform X1 [Balaenoptera musculus]XP_036723018.1 RAD9, HUS1, RAD1-interacting nuclear orphan protein 1 isoform X1 [Balaenoptera musculus]XP_036723019.1 RAD9, HUS1, RAD1-interacting nuclear orphan protein 1 isoform X1 [Balaenoptera musculus]XP_036723020.1 RAD9, HUS1, RAD1-interacting nuclear orphan protein 1 isoform X1 [Balaenoptera muscu